MGHQNTGNIPLREKDAEKAIKMLQGYKKMD